MKRGLNRSKDIVEVRELHKKLLKKIFIRKTIISIIFAVSVAGVVIYTPIEIKYKSLLERQVTATERFDSKMKSINAFKYIKSHINDIYSSEDKISEINNVISKIEGELSNGVTEKLEDLISNLTNMVSEISASNEMELQNTFNNINEDKLKGFNGEEIKKVQSYVNDFDNEFKERHYKSAREILSNLNIYINDVQKEATARRIKETYDEKSSEDPSLRQPKYINGILLVNKEYGLPDSYGSGEDKEAREAFEKMKSDAEKEGIYLYAFSTYRSYWSQNSLYWNYVSNYGEDPTDTFSAKPGFSEHQTGLAFDIGGVDRSLWAEDDFKNTKEAEWLKNNSYKYGFILRYPEGKEWKTGFVFESWHFRYIGPEHSKHFKDSNLTLEEYLGV